MTYQVLARKWRPRRFSEMVGQEHVVRALSNALDTDRLHHAYLFTGTRGVGKTTVARILAKALNCEAGLRAEPCGECASCMEVDEGRFVDLIEVDAASRAKVDETRELMDNVQYAPARGRFKVYLIDEVHMFSKPSFNALLKTLEEPPPHVKFLLATTDPQKLPVTVLSRCLQFHLRQLPETLITAHLRELADAEGVEAEAGALASIAYAARGSLRDALSLMDQAIAFGAGALRDAEVRDMLGIADQDGIWQLLEALAEGNGLALLELVEALASGAPDFDAMLADLLAALQQIAVAQVVPNAPEDPHVDVDRLRRLAATLSAEDVQLCYQIGVLGRRDMPFAINPRSGLEMVLLRMLAFRPADAAAGTLAPSTAAPPRNVAPLHSTAKPPSVSKEMPRSRERAPDPVAAPKSPVSTANAALGADEDAPSTPPDLPSDLPNDPGREPVAASEDVDPHGPEVAAAGAGSVLTPDTWAATVKALALAGLARELAHNVELASHEAGLVRLRIEPAHAQLRGVRAEEAIRTALTRYLGVEMRIELEVGTGDGHGETPAQERKRLASERHAAATQTIRSDPGVAAICDMFGATVDPNGVTPTDGESSS